MQGTPYDLVHETSGAQQSYLNWNLTNRGSKTASEHGSSNSPSTNKTTHYYQTQSRLKRCTTRQKERYSATAALTVAGRKHRISGDRVLQISIVVQQATSNHTRQQQQPRTSTAGHRSNMVQQRATKAKAMAATGPPAATTTTKETASSATNRLGKEINNQQGGKGAKGKLATKVCY